MRPLALASPFVVPLSALLACSGGAGGSGGGGGDGGGAWDWQLPAGFPKPRVPPENPMSAVKVELGRRLFFDVRLSLNETQSCATCHQQEKAFTDGRAQGLGSTGELHPRGPMSVVNVGYLTALTWANPLVDRLEQQALLPLFGEAPVELGFSGQEDELLARLEADPLYADLFPQAFPDDDPPISVTNVTYALAAFERSIISSGSAYDRYAYLGDTAALSEGARRGRDLFFSEALECFHCHGGFNFSDSVATQSTEIVEQMFHNTALYNVDGMGAYPPDNTGVHGVTGDPADMGRFRAPTLRNIALTAPYMHDGSVATLDEALDHYAAGGRTISSGPWAGVGADSPLKSEFLVGFTLTPAERADVLAFLEALTDEALVTDPRFSDPWAQ